MASVGVNWYRQGARAAADLLFPPRCVFCEAECLSRPGQPLLCPTCDQSLAPAAGARCGRCGLTCSTIDLPRGDCGHCRGERLHFSAVRTIGSYQDVLRQAVLRSKHAANSPLAYALGQRLAECVCEHPFAERPDQVAPVPAHWLKRWWRGTNAAETLSRALAASLGLPHWSGLLVCRRNMARQATLTPPQRKLNVKDAFRVSRLAKVRGRRVLPVDDVMTTGATANEAARILLAAGAATVCVAAVSRSSPDF